MDSLICQAVINDVRIAITKDMVSKLDLIYLENGIYSLLHQHKNYSIEVINCDVANRYIELLINGHYSKIYLKYRTNMVIEEMGMDQNTLQKEKNLLSPMPGKVLEISVKNGDFVNKGEPLLVLEAMKMENILKANSDQIIGEVMVSLGDSVIKNQLLISFNSNS